jgi:hypothetical protein
MRGEGEFWDFFLADRLHKTPDEIRAMPARDYVGLQAWYEVKGVMTDLAVRTETNRAR